jgi:hypothetical protein
MLNKYYLSCEEVARIFTAYDSDTIRALARRNELPVAYWEPVFKRDVETAQAIIGVIGNRGPTNERNKRR